MSKKLMLLALAVAGLASFVLPAFASAAAWEIDVAEKFTVANEAGTTTVLTQKGSTTKVACGSVTGEGVYAANRTEGTLSLIFTGCKENVFNSSCTTFGAAAGEIRLTGLRFDNVMVENTSQAAGGTPGINITPPEKATVYTKFTCLGGINFEVTGNGLIGDITTPECGGSSKTATIDWQSKEAGVQRYMQEETGAGTNKTVYDLTSHETIFGGTTSRTAAMDASAIITFANTRKINCP
jgi:hypothetical protein